MFLHNALPLFAVLYTLIHHHTHIHLYRNILTSASLIARSFSIWLFFLFTLLLFQAGGHMCQSCGSCGRPDGGGFNQKALRRNTL